MPSISVAPKSSLRLRESEASSASCTARRNPFCSVPRHRWFLALNAPPAGRHAGPIYALENARRPDRHAGGGIRISGGVGCPTMPIGPHDHNLTPPTAMLRHFLKRRLQLYLDFIVNLVDVRDVAEGLVLAMERGQAGHRYILGGESMPLRQILELMAEISGRRSVHGAFRERQGRRNGSGNAGVHRRSRDAPAAIRYRRRRSYRIAGGGLVDRKSTTRTGLCTGCHRASLAGNHAHLLDAGHHRPEWSSTPSNRARSFHMSAGLAVDPIAHEGPRHDARSWSIVTFSSGVAGPLSGPPSCSR